MTDDDVKRLRELAERATPGPWMRLFGERTVYDRMKDGCRGVPIACTDLCPPMASEAANLDYIAAASPDVLLALLDERDAMQRERDDIRSAGLRALGEALDAVRERDAALALLRDARREIESVDDRISLPTDPPNAVVARINALLGDGGEG